MQGHKKVTSEENKAPYQVIHEAKECFFTAQNFFWQSFSKITKDNGRAR